MMTNSEVVMVLVGRLRFRLALGIVLVHFSLGVPAQSAACGIGLDSLLRVGLPVVVIETLGGEEPTFEEADAPEGCWGGGIRNATKVPGRVRIYDADSLRYDSGDYVAKQSGMTVKVRGNGSARNPKKPYKIKLQKKGDMLGLGPRFSDKDWLLLKVENMKVPVGMALNELCGLPWTPRYQFVNVLMNGDFRGLYLLAEQVGRNAGCRLDVDKATGFIAELDAYWWNEDFYIPSSFPEPMNYTLKYPDSDDLTDSLKACIAGVLERMEQSLSDGSYEQTIDVQSFARWLLAHDMLGNIDGGGSNIFLTRHDAEADTLVRMACLWDFDAIMLADDVWDDAHDRYFFHRLWNSPDRAFATQYVALWQALGDSVYQGLTAFFDRFLASDLCPAVERSIVLNNSRWSRCDRSAAENIELARQYFSRRWEWLDQAIGQLTVGINDVALTPDTCRRLPDGNPGSASFDLQGRRVGSSLQNKATKPGAQLRKGIYIRDGRKVVEISGDGSP